LRETFFWSNVPHRAGVDSGPQSQIPDISVIPEEGVPGLIPAWSPSAAVTRASIPDGLRVPELNPATERSVFNVTLPFPGLELKGGWPPQSRGSARFCHDPTCLPERLWICLFGKSLISLRGEALQGAGSKSGEIIGCRSSRTVAGVRRASAPRCSCQLARRRPAIVQWWPSRFAVNALCASCPGAPRRCRPPGNCARFLFRCNAAHSWLEVVASLACKRTLMVRYTSRCWRFRPSTRICLQPADWSRCITKLRSLL